MYIGYFISKHFIAYMSSLMFCGLVWVHTTDAYIDRVVPEQVVILWAAVFTFNPYLLISINELLISTIHLLISINELLISINDLLISINTASSTVFIDIYNSFIDINKGFIDINNSFIDINKYG